MNNIVKSIRHCLSNNKKRQRKIDPLDSKSLQQEYREWIKRSSNIEDVWYLADLTNKNYYDNFRRINKIIK